jgi:hypothetical protein
MKRLKELLRTKRAFSAVIAALILMLLAVAAGVVVYAYVIGWIGGATKSQSGQYGELSLDSATAVASTKIITAYVRNIGGKSVTPSKAYVSDTQATSISPTTAIAEEATATLTINATSPGLTAATTYEVKIVCIDGTSLTFSVKAS